LIIPLSVQLEIKKSIMSSDKINLMNKIVEFCSEPKTAKQIAENFYMNQNTIRSHYIYKMVKLGTLKKVQFKSYIKSDLNL
jgi:predicted HTH transcriptional regulator